MPADLPIPFTPAMSRAILDGRKTQTRRLLSPASLRIWTGSLDTPGRSIKPSRELFEIATEEAADFRMIDGVLTWTAKARDYQAPAERTRWQGCLTYEPGMKLWVREAWHGDIAFDKLASSKLDPDTAIWYAADGADLGLALKGKRRPGMYMPRWASRTTLVVTEARVERLQDITEADAMAEGWPQDLTQQAHMARSAIAIRDAYPVGWYAALINSIHGPGTWERNPCVTVTTFTVHQQNIDAMEKANAA